MNADTIATEATAVSDLPMMEGSITVGPVNMPRGWKGMNFMRRMEEFGLYIHRDDDARFLMSPSLGGFTITASGPGVLGYLVDAEGLDADDTVLELFALPLKAGLPFSITGSHDLGGGRRMECKTLIEACAEAFHGIKATQTRELIAA